MELQLDQYQSLLGLSRSENLINGSFELFIDQAIHVLSNELKVSRASFWSYDAENELIFNELLFDRNANNQTSGEILLRKDFPNYFEAFKNELAILAEDAAEDPRTREFKENYLDAFDIKSMLDVQVSIQGKLFGIICLEQIAEKREWKKSEELYVSSVASYIAQAYIIKLKNKEEQRRKQSEINYQQLFLDSPIPMWVYDMDSYYFLDVNTAAISNYGYSKEEFLKLTIFDIRPEEEVQRLEHFFKTNKRKKWSSREWKHQLKNGEIIDVEISSDWTTYRGKDARIVIALNITNEKRLIQDNEISLNKFKDFAFYTSHNLRGPVSRLLGLNKLLKFEREKNESSDSTLDHIQNTIVEIDEMIIELNKMLEK
ncbi:MAG: PAS domain S-box protein [Reichenbachiella sp.]|uniref:PAS domain S-box protein n=1 Tax=Reichenbachiella sp. TaxID=2184521 RepID=UPI00296680CB|nr:PAS domain S-box protein [Reichenbachiella sp.]MDW3211360.1 PAS domain S-box protein [Reichenbachiella sp.]